mgnify:CR=1 FL=1
MYGLRAIGMGSNLDQRKRVTDIALALSPFGVCAHDDEVLIMCNIPPNAIAEADIGEEDDGEGRERTPPCQC